MENPSESCDLCGLPLRAGTVSAMVAGKIFHFCCPGCRQVFRMLMDASDHPDPARFRETELFRKCREMGIVPASEADLQQNQEIKTVVPESKIPEISPDRNPLVLDLKISGMWCPACAWVIDASLEKMPGVFQAVTSFSTDRFRCAYDPVLASPEAVIRHIRKLGYTASDADRRFPSEKKGEFIHFCVCGLFTMNVMMLSFALYHGFFTEFSKDEIHRLSVPIFAMACIPFFYGGWQIHRRALAGIFRFHFSMESLISTASASAFFYSLFNLALGSIHLYFDTASMLVTLTLLGKMLERNARDRVLADMEAFFSLRPSKARLCTEQFPEGRYVSAEMLQPGDRFRVEEGEIVPADGVILDGRGTVDTASLTGEILPVNGKPGDRLMSGSKILQGGFTLRAQAVGETSTLGQMIRIMEQALSRKTPFEGKTDRILQYFVPVIMLLAAGTGLTCLLAGFSAEAAMIRAITVMVISCPCALGIAVPLARVAGISAAGRNGLLVREFSCFERAEKADAVVFDKTGTLTVGRYALLDIHTNGEILSEQALALAAGLERNSDHPVGAEIRRVAVERKISPVLADAVREYETGISGMWNDLEIRIGSREFAGPEKPLERSDFPEDDLSEKACRTQVYLRIGAEAVAVLVFGDRMRDGAVETVRELAKSGREIFLISGDGQDAVDAVALAVGIEIAMGTQLPADKARFVASLQKKGRTVIMVGDGINDAPALVQADIAVAVHSGSSPGEEAADITLMRSDPRQLLFFLALARRVNRKIHQNLWCALIYNLLNIPIAMSGLLSPLVAVTAMLLSSLTVIGNTLSLVRKPPS